MDRNTKKITKTTLLSVFFLLIGIYAFFNTRDLVFGVKIRNVNLVDGATVGTSIQEVTGNAKNAINLSLNGREISIDKEGYFHETIALLLGYNVIELKARDKFGNSDQKDYKLIYKK